MDHDLTKKHLFRSILKLNLCQSCIQPRNQLGTPGVAKSFLRGSQIFQTMSNSLQLTMPQQVGERFCRGGFSPLSPHLQIFFHFAVKFDDISYSPYLKEQIE